MAELEPIKNIIETSKPKSNHGGARPGAGHPPGKKTERVIEREATLRAFKDRVAKNADRLLNAQMDLAVGEKYLMVVTTVGEGAKERRETTVVTDIELIKQYLDSDGDASFGEENEYYFMTTKPANNQALDSLLNRTYGKPAESVDVTSNGNTLSNIIYMPAKKSEDYDVDA